MVITNKPYLLILTFMFAYLIPWVKMYNVATNITVQNKNSLGIMADIYEIIDLTEANLYIIADQHGNIVIKNYLFETLCVQTVCEAKLSSMEKIPDESCFAVICNHKFIVYCYIQTLIKIMEHEQKQQIRGYLVWPYYFLYINETSSYSLKRKCQIDLVKMIIVCSSQTIFYNPEKILSDSEKQVSVLAEISTSSSKSYVYFYRQDKHALEYSLSINFEAFKIIDGGQRIIFFTPNSFYLCLIQCCDSSLTPIMVTYGHIQQKNTLVVMQDILYYIGKDRNLVYLEYDGIFYDQNIYDSSEYDYLYETSQGMIAYNYITGAIDIFQLDYLWTNTSSTSSICSTTWILPTNTNITQIRVQSRVKYDQCEQKSMFLNSTNIENAQQKKQQCQISYCSKCLNLTHCSQCKSSYQLSQSGQYCEQSIYVTYVSLFFSLPYSSLAVKIIFSDFLEELWFYEYHNYEYKKTRFALQFIGNVNRNKFLPIYFKDMLGVLYNDYSNYRVGLSHHKKQFSNQKFKSIQGQAIFFISNTAKMYLEAYIYNVLLFISFKIIAIATKSWPLIHNQFKRNLINSVLIIILLDSHVQFVTFMFFEQVKSFFAQTYFDKVNLVFSLLLTFIIIFYAFGSYPLFSHLADQQFDNVYPGITKSSKEVYLYLLLTNSSRKFLLGIIQNFYTNFLLQIFVLNALNLTTFLMFLSLLRVTRPYNKTFKQKQIQVILPLKYLLIKTVLYGALTVFSFCALICHITDFISSQILFQFQIVVLSGIIIICLWQLYLEILKKVVEILYWLISKCQQKKEEQILQKKQ